MMLDSQDQQQSPCFPTKTRNQDEPKNEGRMLYKEHFLAQQKTYGFSSCLFNNVVDGWHTQVALTGRSRPNAIRFIRHADEFLKDGMQS